MKTRNKLIVLQIFTLIILLLSIIAIQQIQLREQKLYISSKIKSDELIIDNVLEFNKDRYLGAAKTNSCWNEIADFTLNPDTNWAKPAIGEIIHTFELNYIVVFNSSFTNLYEVYDKPETRISVSLEMLNSLFSKSPFCHFFMECESGYIELFGSKIVKIDDSEHKGKAYGYLLIGKLWNKKFINEIENVTGFNIKINENTETDSSKVYSEGIDNQNIFLHKTIKNWKEESIAKIEFKIKNQLFEEYYFSRYLSLFIAIFSIITILFFFIAVRKWISMPLVSITTSLSTENVNVLDIYINKKNEFGEIARLIKQFYVQKKNLEKEIIDRLKVDEELKIINDSLEIKVKERTNELETINDTLQAEISEREKAEKIVKKQIEDLAAKNTEMERFTYTVSHDLKSPLITINGFAGLILEKIKSQEYDDLEVDLNRIVNATNKMQELLKDLLELSKVGRMTNPSTSFNMSELAHEVVELLQGILKENKIKIIIQENMPIVLADKQRIMEVLQNLIENAVKFMNYQENPLVCIGSKIINNETVFFVKDNGVGIEEKFHQKIFGLFEKLDQHSEGTGIGLALVKRIVELHNGKVWVESQINKGVTFYFTINKQSSYL